MAADTNNIAKITLQVETKGLPEAQALTNQLVQLEQLWKQITNSIIAATNAQKTYATGAAKTPAPGAPASPAAQPQNTSDASTPPEGVYGVHNIHWDSGSDYLQAVLEGQKSVIESFKQEWVEPTKQLIADLGKFVQDLGAAESADSMKGTISGLKAVISDLKVVVSDLGNYRQAAETTVVGKILEKVLAIDAGNPIEKVLWETLIQEVKETYSQYKQYLREEGENEEHQRENIEEEKRWLDMMGGTPKPMTSQQMAGLSPQDMDRNALRWKLQQDVAEDQHNRVQGDINSRAGTLGGGPTPEETSQLDALNKTIQIARDQIDALNGVIAHEKAHEQVMADRRAAAGTPAAPPAPAAPVTQPVPAPTAQAGQIPANLQLILPSQTTGNVFKDDSPAMVELSKLAQLFQSWMATQQARPPAAPAAAPASGPGTAGASVPSQQPAAAPAAPASAPGAAAAGGGVSPEDLQGMAAATDPMQQFLVTVNQTTGAIQGYSQRIDETRKAMEEGTVSTEDATKAIAEYEQSVQEAVAKALPELQKLLDVLKAIGQQHPRLNLDTSGVGSAMVDLKNAIGGNGAGTPGGIGSPAMATGPAAGGLPAALGGAKPCLCTCTEGGAGAAPGIGGQPGAGGQGAAGGQPAAAAQVGAGPAVAQSPSQFTALMSSWKSFGSQVEQFGTATMENFAKASNRWKP